jgi:anaerobic glycerol-3-phosphate dehydrogenase
MRKRCSQARFSHGHSTAAVDPGMSALRSLGLLDLLSNTPVGSSVARLASTPDCAASPQNPVKSGLERHMAAKSLDIRSYEVKVDTFGRPEVP